MQYATSVASEKNHTIYLLPPDVRL